LKKRKVNVGFWTQIFGHFPSLESCYVVFAQPGSLGCPSHIEGIPSSKQMMIDLQNTRVAMHRRAIEA
jgi:hypothetical protein